MSPTIARVDVMVMTYVNATPALRSWPMRSRTCCTASSEIGSSSPNRDASDSSNRSINGRKSAAVGSRSVTSLAESGGSPCRHSGVDNVLVSLLIAYLYALDECLYDTHPPSHEAEQLRIHPYPCL